MIHISKQQWGPYEYGTSQTCTEICKRQLSGVGESRLKARDVGMNTDSRRGKKSPKENKNKNTKKEGR